MNRTVEAGKETDTHPNKGGGGKGSNLRFPLPTCAATVHEGGRVGAGHGMGTLWGRLVGGGWRRKEEGGGRRKEVLWCSGDSRGCRRWCWRPRDSATGATKREKKKRKEPEINNGPSFDLPFLCN